MKYTLLELVQVGLSSINGDDVTSINDTPESSQVVKIVKAVYNDIVVKADLPEHKSLYQLVETSASSPTIMTVPTAVNSLDWVKYNWETSDDTDDKFKKIEFVPLPDFLGMMHQIDESDTTDFGTFNYTIGTYSVKFFYNKLKSPTWYTTYDDGTVVFDSVDTGVETYLRATKSLGYGTTEPTWTETDGFTPSLDTPQFALLVNEVKAMCWAELRQTQHQKAEVNARRGWVRVQSTKERVKGNSAYSLIKGYGRK